MLNKTFSSLVLPNVRLYHCNIHWNYVNGEIAQTGTTRGMLFMRNSRPAISSACMELGVIAPIGATAIKPNYLRNLRNKQP